MNILFRCEGSLEIGMGHIVRCMALAKRLEKDHGCCIKFAIRESEFGIRIVEESFKVISTPVNDNSLNHSSWLIECIKFSNTDVLILDVRDELTSGDIKKIKGNTNVKITTIDDPEEKRLMADLAFYPPIPQLKRWDWNGFEGKLFSGWDYVILRPEFQETYLKPKNECPKILVAMGGTDPQGLTINILNTIDLMEDKFSILAMVGPMFMHKAKLDDFCSKSSKIIEIIIDPPNVAQIMFSADLAVISFGMIAYEVAATKTPAIYIPSSKDHALSAGALVNAGMGISLGYKTKINYHLLEKKLSQMIGELNSTEKPIIHSDLIDGSGATRIANHILK